MQIFKFRNKENNNQFPKRKGDYLLSLPIFNFNQNRTLLDGYVNASNKDDFLIDSSLPQEQFKQFKSIAKIYSNYLKVEVKDFIIITNFPRTKATRWNQNFAIGQVRSKSIVDGVLKISVHVLRTRIYKNYSDREEFVALGGPGMFSKVNERYHEKLLSSALGKIEINDKTIIPFSFLSDETPSEEAKEMFDQPLTLAELQEFLDRMAITPDFAAAVAIEIDVHSPPLGAIKFATDSMQVIINTVAQFREENNPELAGLLKAIEAGNAIDPTIELEYENIRRVEIFNNNIKSAATHIYE